MGLFSWLIIGGLAGWVASMVMGKNKSMGLVANIVVGIVGGVIGGFVFSVFGRTGVTGFNLYSFMVATVGAIILLYVVRKIKK